MRTNQFSFELEISAENAWSELLEKAGLPHGAWTLERLSKREDHEFAGITYLARHPDGHRYTFKHQLRPDAKEGFAAHYNTQVRAYEVFPHSKGFTLPRPVFIDLENQSSLMEYVTGQPLSELMKMATSDKSQQLELIRRAGSWLDMFHRCQVDEVRAFQPKFTVRYYENLREKITSGERKVVAKPLVLKGIEHLIEIAPNYAARETVSAMQHGDFHMRNLIVSNQQVAGIDVSKSDPAPVGYDIAKLLLDITSHFFKAYGIRPGEVVAEEVKSAFFEGYTLVDRDDPSVNFLLYPRVLATLLDVPQQQGLRSSSKQKRLRQLRPIAVNAFQ